MILFVVATYYSFEQNITRWIGYYSCLQHIYSFEYDIIRLSIVLFDVLLPRLTIESFVQISFFVKIFMWTVTCFDIPKFGDTGSLNPKNVTFSR